MKLERIAMCLNIICAQVFVKSFIVKIRLEMLPKMLSTEKSREMEDRRETLEATTDNAEFLITETKMTE